MRSLSAGPNAMTSPDFNKPNFSTDAENSADETARQSLLTEQLNQRLADMQTRIRNILTTLPLGLLLIADKKNIAASNSRIESIFGYSKNELAGKPVTVLFPELNSLAVNEKPLQVAALRKGGEQISCEIFVNEIEEDDGSRRMFVHVQDISERQRLEQLRRDFLNMVSHDLRTPLTAITMGLDMLQSGTCGEMSGSAMTVIKQAKTSSDFVISMVTELLDSEKIQAKEFELDVKPTMVKTVIDKAVSATSPVANKAKVSIETDFTNDDFKADEDRIVQVLINVIGNAIKYSPRESRIIVKGGIVGTGIKFSVTDTGPGIPKSLQTAIFEPYRQLQQPKQTKRRGFGLGLAICKLLIEAHGGSISVDSVEGKGSTFSFSIPM